jgi:hypothetical protein
MAEIQAVAAGNGSRSKESWSERCLLQTDEGWRGSDFFGLGPFVERRGALRGDERIDEDFDVSMTTEHNSFFR